VDPDEGLLNDVLSGGHIADQQHGQPEQLLVVPDVQGREVV
jgi:hypothetical protein